MPSIEQIRAARALLDWSQTDLADKAGLSQTGIARLENGTHTPNTLTLDKIVNALEKQGIHFTAKGLEKNEYPVYNTSADTHEKAYLKLLEDAHEHLLTLEDPELLIMFSDDSVSSPAVNQKYRQMRQDNIKIRQLIKQGNTYIVGPLKEYRYIPEKYFINRVTLVYGERVANESTDVCQGVIRVADRCADREQLRLDVIGIIVRRLGGIGEFDIGARRQDLHHARLQAGFQGRADLIARKA